MKSALPAYGAVILLAKLLDTKIDQESFYSKLKKFADELNTNLYVSNIPKNMNEHVRILCRCVPLGALLTQDRNSLVSLHRTRFVQVGFFATLLAPAVVSASPGKL